MDKRELLDRLGGDREDRLVLARVLDKAEQAGNRNVPAYTDFLSPAQQHAAAELLRLAGFSPESWTALGGVGGAERNILFFLPDWMEREEAESQSPLRCLRAAFRAEDKLSHRDILGSLMGLGVVREKIGDILVGEDGCDLVVLDTVADFLLENWISAGRARLRLESIEPWQMRVPPVKCQEVRDTVSSLRLDAVAAAAFHMARGKAAALIESGRVQVNWRECAKPDKLLAQGDTVSARGLGKFELAQVGGVTKKGRTSIVVRRYV